MKAIFYLPAHPSHFSDKYSQEEINAAWKKFAQEWGGLPLDGYKFAGVECRIIILRDTSKTVGVFEDKGDGSKPVMSKNPYLLAHFKTLTDNVTEILEAKRGNFPRA